MTARTPRLLSEADLAKVTGGAAMRGGAGADSLVGTYASDVIDGGSGGDLIVAAAGDDTASGEDGNDTMRMGFGNDLAWGGAGSDMLDGGSGADTLSGEDGDDSLDGGARDGAADLAIGGQGNDAFAWAPGDGNDEFLGGAGRDTLQLHGMSFGELFSAFQFEGDPGLRLAATSNTVSFVDASGAPATFSGTITLGGHTLRFSDIEQIRLN